MTRLTSTTKLLSAVCGARGVPLPCAKRVELARNGGK